MHYFEALSEGERPSRPMDLIAGCLENGSGLLLADEGVLPAEFFDLSSGFAGELVQKLANYDIRMAAVVPDESVHSSAFQAFAREANRSKQVRFFASRVQAVEWLTGGP